MILPYSLSGSSVSIFQLFKPNLPFPISSFTVLQDALSFGRPGYGAPVRTKSGRIRTQILGNTDIRFQDNKSVRKTIDNNIRYQGDPEMKAMYHRDLGESRGGIYQISMFFLACVHHSLLRQHMSEKGGITFDTIHDTPCIWNQHSPLTEEHFS